MTRFFALCAPVLIGAFAATAAALAGVADGVQFTVQPVRDPGQVHVRFATDGRDNSRWSTTLPAGDLAGFDPARLNATGSGPVRFTIAREAGRLDCAGNGGNRRATGSCRFTADPSFVQFLVANGIDRPSADQAFSLMAINARRDIVTALSDARYPKPTVDTLVPLIAVGVDAGYIARLAAVGYRPPTLDSLLQFKALGVDAAYIGAFRQLGYANLRPGDLVQLKALGVTPQDVHELRQRGYRDLSVGTLIQLKALGHVPGTRRRAR